MTNERTAAAIRRHLRHAADEQPSNDALQASLAITATLPQRPRWQAVARDLASPSVAIPWTAVRLGLLAGLLILAIAGIAAFGGGGSRSRTPFEGTWTSTDPGDGSHQTLVIGAGATPVVHFEDDDSIMCRRGGDTVPLFLADGPGGIVDARLTVEFGESGCVVWRIPPFEARYDYRVDSDTLRDDTGTTWYRQP